MLGGQAVVREGSISAREDSRPASHICLTHPTQVGLCLISRESSAQVKQAQGGLGRLDMDCSRSYSQFIPAVGLCKAQVESVSGSLGEGRVAGVLSPAESRDNLISLGTEVDLSQEKAGSSFGLHVLCPIVPGLLLTRGNGACSLGGSECLPCYLQLGGN